jgi:pimeloyl-ACP methyl ester carboxylesterase
MPPLTPERPSDPPLRTAWLPRGPFSYTDEGEGPVLVALHGLPGSARDYRWLAPALDGVRLIRLEQPGFGATPRATEPSSRLFDRARFVSDALDAIGVERYAVLGHSMGGPLAMCVAAGERVTGLALLASVGLHPHRLMRKVGRQPDLAWMLDVYPIARALLPPMRKGFVRAGFPASTPDEAILHCTRIFSQFRFSEVHEVVPRVRTPALIAWAEDDPLVESAIALSLSPALPPGPRIAFDDGGHNIQKTRAIELGAALVSWTRENAASAP